MYCRRPFPYYLGCYNYCSFVGFRYRLGESQIESDILVMKPGRISNKWLAGLLDGDCTMTSTHSGKAPTPRVSFTQLDREVVAAVHARYGGHLSVKGGASMTYIDWTGRGVADILDSVIPYLVVKWYRASWILNMVPFIGKPLTEEKIRIRTELHHKIRNDSGFMGNYLTISRQWLAGFIEADGTVSVTNIIPIVSIAQKDGRILHEIQKRYGGSLSGPGSNNCYDLSWRGRASEPLLRKVLPHMKIKHEQARWALDMCHYIGPTSSMATKERIYQRRLLAQLIRSKNSER